MKVIILQKLIPHYRIELFNHLARKYDLTVVTLIKPTFSENIADFKIIHYGKSRIHYNISCIKVFFAYDKAVFIIGDDLRHIWLPVFRFFINFFFKKPRAFIWWGTNEHLSFRYIYKLKNILFLKHDLFVFYDYLTKHIFISKHPEKSGRSIVANNTVFVQSDDHIDQKNRNFTILNVGSLDERKDNITLIKEVHQLLIQGFSDIRLIFIGDGANKYELVSYVQDMKIDSNIIFLEKINDIKLLKRWYKIANISVSLGQAGLSILQSFGFGRAYITTNTAISGGEVNNIIHGYNGFLISNNLKFSSLIEMLYEDRNLLNTINYNAHEYYKQFCTIENYSQSVSKAIDICSKEIQ
ncbi:glycosyltransferase [Amylibacter sp.]|nr:glycosyltransferase [Amylibacter sp.]